MCTGLSADAGTRNRRKGRIGGRVRNRQSRRERAGAKRLLEFTRGHWGIENGLHGVRDGTFAKDASRIRKGSATQVMAIVRNIVIFFFNQLGHRSAAAATRHYVCHPHETLEIQARPI